jgi:hypothetical protein
MRSVAAMERGMLMVTTENVAGHQVVKVKGQCFGVVVRSRGLGGNGPLLSIISPLKHLTALRNGV